MQAWFDRHLSRGQDLAPLMADFGELLLESTQQRFLAGKSPEGITWAPVKRGGRPLFDTRIMHDQIAPVSVVVARTPWREAGQGLVASDLAAIRGGGLDWQTIDRRGSVRLANHGLGGPRMTSPAPFKHPAAEH